MVPSFTFKKRSGIARWRYPACSRGVFRPGENGGRDRSEIETILWKIIDHFPYIFKPYVAGHPEGHGLGLAIVKRFVDDHRWTIRAEFPFNRGTVLMISGIEHSPSGRAKV